MPSLLAFSASWCLPSQATKPILARLGEYYGDKLAIEVVNVDKRPDLRESHHVQGCPTFIFFGQDGKEMNRHVGALSEEQLKELIEQHLETKI